MSGFTKKWCLNLPLKLENVLNPTDYLLKSSKGLEYLYFSSIIRHLTTPNPSYFVVSSAISGISPCTSLATNNLVSFFFLKFLLHFSTWFVCYPQADHHMLTDTVTPLLRRRIKFRKLGLTRGWSKAFVMAYSPLAKKICRHDLNCVWKRIVLCNKFTWHKRGNRTSKKLSKGFRNLQILGF